MKIKTIALITLSTIFIGCTAIVPIILDDGAEEITLNESKPSQNYEVIGAVIGVDGSGCGSFGYEGSHDRATIDLQNKIKELHGAYGQLTSVVEPHLDGGCYKNEYIIKAVAYRKIEHKAIPAPIYIENTDEENFTKKMRELKSLLDDGILTQKEYETQKAKLLEAGFTK
jgi:hypothetical protein